MGAGELAALPHADMSRIVVTTCLTENCVSCCRHTLLAVMQKGNVEQSELLYQRIAVLDWNGLSLRNQMGQAKGLRQSAMGDDGGKASFDVASTDLSLLVGLCPRDTSFRLDTTRVTSLSIGLTCCKAKTKQLLLFSASRENCRVPMDLGVEDLQQELRFIASKISFPELCALVRPDPLSWLRYASQRVQTKESTACLKAATADPGSAEGVPPERQAAPPRRLTRVIGASSITLPISKAIVCKLRVCMQVPRVCEAASDASISFGVL
eukprot:1434864-Amphidinium_carterae.1